MVRSDGSIYARFKDTPESGNATASKEGNVELVENRSNLNVCDIERQNVSTKVLATAIRKIYICLLMICVVVIVLLVFTATNFVLIMKSRDKVVLHKSTTQDATDTQYHIQVRDELEISPQDPLARDFMASDHPCELYFGPTCYWLSPVKRKNFHKALESCTIDGGDPGVVHSSNYQLVLKYMRQNSEQDASSAWLGMTRDPGTGEIQALNHGKFEDFLHWLPGYPSTESDATSLCLQADKNVNSTNNGFLNVNPESRDKVQSILCEMPWSDGGQTQGDYDYTTDSPSNSTEY